MQLSDEERQATILQKVVYNLYPFLDFMERREPPYPNFLRDVMTLHSKVPEASFRRLFLSVCALHKGQEILVAEEMIISAMISLTERSHNPRAALGLLHLAFQNSIALTTFSLDLLTNFQTQYEDQLAKFLKMLPKIKPPVINLLPPTIFCLTPPMLKYLREGGEILYQQVPLEYLGPMLSILCHSFADSLSDYELFLTTLKDGFLVALDEMRSAKFDNLLYAIAELAQS